MGQGRPAMHQHPAQAVPVQEENLATKLASAAPQVFSEKSFLLFTLNDFRSRSKFLASISIRSFNSIARKNSKLERSLE
jgi:hypothetical protein